MHLLVILAVCELERGFDRVVKCRTSLPKSRVQERIGLVRLGYIAGLASMMQYACCEHRHAYKLTTH